MPSEVPRSLFYDGGTSEGQEAATTVIKSGDLCNLYDVRGLHFPPGEEFDRPTLFTPEGTGKGLRQIKFLTGIPRQHRR